MNDDTLWKIIIALAIFAMSSTIMLQFAFAYSAYGEEYFYLDDWETYGIIEQERPLVCAFDFDDPDYNSEVITLTEKSFDNWQQAFSDYAKYPEKWQMEFTVVPISEQSLSKWEDDCAIILFYLPQPNRQLWDELGLIGVYDSLAITDNQGQYADIYVVYRDIVYDNDDLTEWHYEDVIPYDLEETLDHELGHALSLAHPTVTNSSFEPYGDGDGVKSFSIMITPVDVGAEIVPFEVPIYFEITEYDVRSLERLYGENGFEEGRYIVIPEVESPFEAHAELDETMYETLKKNIIKYPQWFPENYIGYLVEVGLL